MFHRQVLEHGALNGKLLRFRCGLCGCVFLCNPLEAWNYSDGEDYHFETECPECNARCGTREAIGQKELGYENTDT